MILTSEKKPRRVLYPVAQEAAQNMESPHENCLTYLSKALALARFVPSPNQTLGCSAAASFSLRKESKSQKLCRISCLIMFFYPSFPFLVLCYQHSTKDEYKMGILPHSFIISVTCSANSYAFLFVFSPLLSQHRLSSFPHVLMLFFRKTAFRPVKLSETNLVPARAHLKLLMEELHSHLDRTQTKHGAPLSPVILWHKLTPDTCMPPLSMTPF